MIRLHSPSLRLALVAACFLAAPSPTVQADPLTTFTLSDLGSGVPSFANGPNGGVVIAGNGQATYPFQISQDTSVATKQLLSSHIPTIDAAPVNDPSTYGNPLNAYSTPLNAITNGQGTYVAIDAYGVNGHMGQAEVYSVQQNPNGTWGTPTALWSGGEQFSGSASAAMASITGINKLNEVLGVGSDGSVGGSGLPQTYLYNLNTSSLLDLSTLGVLTSGGWSNIQPIAIDDQGRILLQAMPAPTTGLTSEQTLLLTPASVSPDEFAAPEPGTLTLAFVAIAALAARRAVRLRASR